MRRERNWNRRNGVFTPCRNRIKQTTPILVGVWVYDTIRSEMAQARRRLLIRFYF